MLRLPRKLDMVLRYITECSPLKMESVAFIVYLQGHAKDFNIAAYGGEIVNMLRLPRKLDMVLRYIKECSPLKTESVAFLVYLQGHAKEFDNITAYGRKS